MLQQQHAATPAVQRPGAPHVVPAKNCCPNAVHAACVVFTHEALLLMQQAPKTGEPHPFEHGTPAPRKLPPLIQQLHESVIEHSPLMSQHPPSGHGVQGLGTHAVLGVQLRFGGTGQLPCVVCVQRPVASQHAPLGGPHGDGLHVAPTGCGVPPMYEQ